MIIDSIYKQLATNFQWLPSEIDEQEIELLLDILNESRPKTKNQNKKAVDDVASW